MRPRLSLIAALVAIAVVGFAAVRSATDETAPVAALQPVAEPSARSARPATGASAAERVVPESREAIQLSFAPIVRRAAPAVVNVYATSRVTVRSPFAGDPFFERFFGGGSPQGASRERSSLGSGVIVDADGLVLTNDHVIKGATEVKVALSDGREFRADVLLADERTDLAVIKLQDVPEPLPALDFADSDAVEVGDLVLAIGNPFAVGQTVTSGIVSAIARSEGGIRDQSFFIQTDAAINPGNSGGALIDLDGKVIGINTAIYSRSGGSIGIGFAIPSNMARTVVAQAVAGGTEVMRPWLGALYQRVTPEIAASLGLDRPRGVLVQEVREGSPADKAGIEPGDVIVSVDDRDIADPPALRYRLAIAAIGSDVRIGLLRNGERLEASATLEAEPGLEEAGRILVGGDGPLAGATLATYDSFLADRLRIRGASSGAAVLAVDPEAPAARLVRPGDVIVGLQGERIETAEQAKAIAEDGGRFWRIDVNRAGRLQRFMFGG
jgi:Do/DeqQ family serine protease